MNISQVYININRVIQEQARNDRSGFSAVDLINKIKLLIRRHVRPFPVFSLYWFVREERGIKAFHRSLLLLRLRGLRRPSHMVGALIGAGVWYFLRLWRIVFRLKRQQGRETEENYGISPGRQVMEMVLFNLCYHIHPAVYYRHLLFLPEKKEYLHAYVLRSELPWFHDFCNRNKPDLRASKYLLENKVEFMEALMDKNFPGIKTLAVVCKEHGLDSFFRQQDVFCKPVMGFGARNAFRIVCKMETNTYTLHPVKGSTILDGEEVNRFLHNALAESPLLIQHVLTDHKDLPFQSLLSGLTTLRVVTAEFDDRSIQVIYAQLEFYMNEQLTSKGIRRYRIYPLDIVTMDVSSVWLEMTRAPYSKEVFKLTNSVKRMIIRAFSDCVAVHRQCIDLRSVAFDLGLTEAGPVFLEANYNWDPEVLYQVYSPAKTAVEKLPAAEWMKEITGWNGF